MLIQFRFKNFRSFRDEQVLSMVASTDKTLRDENTIHATTLSKQRLVRSAVVYGANASGKSNLVSALGFVKSFVQHSADQELEAEIPLQPFLLDNTSSKSRSEFEVTFIHKGIRYQYGFSVDRKRVYEEWLIAYPKGQPQKWFERSPSSESKSEWYFGSQLKGEKGKLVSLTRPDVLFLSVAAKFNHEQLSSVYQWFSKYLRVIEADRDASHFFYTAKKALASQPFSVKLGELLRFADFGVADFSIEKSESLPEDMPEELRQLITSGRGRVQWSGQFNVQLRHRVSGSMETSIPLSLDDESKGTRRLFSIGGPWIDVLQHGYTLVVDELGSSLHPLLARELVSMFHSSDLNPRNAQLVFDTHDTTLLDSSIFRRDQVWFVEKDNGSVSHLYPLLDFSPRKEEALGRGYLRGRYGAIPILGDLAGFGAEAADGKD